MASSLRRQLACSSAFDVARGALGRINGIGGVLAHAADRVAARRECKDGEDEGCAGCQFFRHHVQQSAPEPEGNERTVWLLRNGQPVAINIEIGASDGQNTVVVKGDVKEGDRVITDQTVRNG